MTDLLTQRLVFSGYFEFRPQHYHLKWHLLVSDLEVDRGMFVKRQMANGNMQLDSITAFA